jgi:hypothetical protein
MQPASRLGCQLAGRDNRELSATRIRKSFGRVAGMGEIEIFFTSDFAAQCGEFGQ